jgi:adenosylcobinamide hydrolase
MKQPLDAGLSTHHRIVGKTLLIDLGTHMRVLSSAPRGGGLRTARYILNHQVVPDSIKPKSRTNVSPKRWGDPARYLRRIALAVGADGDCVGLMTAVPMKQLITGRESEKGIWVECYATVGVTNAVRAGEPPRYGTGEGADRTAGTINLILITNACLSASALVGAVQVATESKTGLLRDHAVPSWTGCPGATGTGTDAVVVACAVRGQGPWTSYAGTHTAMGSMIGRVTAGCLSQGLARATQWRRQSSQ